MRNGRVNRLIIKRMLVTGVFVNVYRQRRKQELQSFGVGVNVGEGHRGVSGIGSIVQKQ